MIDLNILSTSRIKLVRQTEIAECGIACVTMIANSYGRHLSLSAIRNMESPSMRGLKISALIALGDKLGLSGQAVRLLLARALYRQPRILLMDEGTAHLDVMLEKTVNAAIAKLGITRVIIAHRPDTIAAADRVYLMQDRTLRELSV